MKEKEEISADFILCTVLDVGEHILRAGGEIQRVEDTVERICRSYGARHVEVFCITSAIIASVRMENGEYSSQMRRVYGSDYNLYRLELMNEVSRKLCENKPGRETAVEMIEYAKNARPYRELYSKIGECLAAGAFAVFFGGVLVDGISAALVQLLSLLICLKLPNKINRFALTAVKAAVSGTLAVLAVGLGVGQNVDKVMIGTIMILIPGVSFGNSLREIFSGDTISGILRLIQSLILALAIAFGYSLAILVMGGVLK